MAREFTRATSADDEVTLPMRKYLTAERIPLTVTYLILAAIAVAMFLMARGFPGGRMGAAAPGFFPQVVSVVLLALSVLGLVELYRSVPERIRVPPRVIAAMSISVGYIGMMHLIGYYPSTLLFAFLMMLVARDRAHPVRVAVDAVIITFCSYLFFELLISAYLPTGVLFD